MRSSGHLSMSFLPAEAQAYLAVGVILAAVMLAGLVWLAVVIRGEDTGSKFKKKAPGPYARSVRHMLNVHVYTPEDFSKRRDPMSGSREVPRRQTPARPSPRGSSFIR